ncbi:unnamed protein product, partial [Chrysoparadoxa australica]
MVDSNSDSDYEDDAEIDANLRRELTNFGKHLKCGVCLSFYKDPVMFPCNHPLCRECAYKTIER